MPDSIVTYHWNNRLSLLFFYHHAYHRTLHSFPTRRSSDLFSATRLRSTGRQRPSRAPSRTASMISCVRAPSTNVGMAGPARSEEHTSELQSRLHLVCRLLLEKKKDIVGVDRDLAESHAGFDRDVSLEQSLVAPFFLPPRLPPHSTLFPYTTLFRSFLRHAPTLHRAPAPLASAQPDRVDDLLRACAVHERGHGRPGEIGRAHV